MSLFNELQGNIIQKPRQLWNYHHILAEQKESEEEKVKRRKAERKALCEQKKAELSKEDFTKRRVKAWYQWNKEERQKFQLEYVDRQNEERDAMIEEIYKEVYDTIPEPINYDKYYADKFKEDDTSYEGKYKMSWRATRLWKVRPSSLKAIKTPIKIYEEKRLDAMMTNLTKMQDRAYNYIKPHLGEISLKDFWPAKKQFLTKNPLWASVGRMRELVHDTDISDSQICSVANALLRDKYIVSELYMGRVAFLLGDVIVTQAGNILRPSLENNIPWLTKDTVEMLHKQRMDWLKKKWEMDIYVIWDAYLLQHNPNEREKNFYFVGT